METGQDNSLEINNIATHANLESEGRGVMFFGDPVSRDQITQGNPFAELGSVVPLHVNYDRKRTLIRNLRDYFLPDFFLAAQYAFSFADNSALAAGLILFVLAAGLAETIVGLELRTFAHLAF